ncbi:MAG TPA: alpha/beta hydrolase-fold protein [Bacteroidales bacterium]|nr:alpha/beta hydrolase-fold protein [Bacteroidales bacterium]
MNTILRFLLAFSLFQFYNGLNTAKAVDEVAKLKNKLTTLSESTENSFLKLSCQSILNVIGAKQVLSENDSTLLSTMYKCFADEAADGSPSKLESYLARQRSFIIAWTSPTDRAISFTWMKLPKDWNPANTYPLYIELHGLWSVANNSIDYLSYPYRNGSSGSFAFEDGYLLSPWGRGNLWYKGISETDITECIGNFEKLANIDQTRKYLCGHSMGGFGAWYIGQKDPSIWAALGIHAGALWYDASMTSDETISRLTDIPVYFVVGTNDGLLSINQTAYNKLDAAGNENIKFVTFAGGHDYLEVNVQNMYLWMHTFTNDRVGIKSISALEEKIILLSQIKDNKAVIQCNIPESSSVSLSVTDMLGRNVAAAYIKNMAKGFQEISCDGLFIKGQIYICTLNTGKHREIVKIVVK